MTKTSVKTGIDSGTPKDNLIKLSGRLPSPFTLTADHLLGVLERSGAIPESLDSYEALERKYRNRWHPKVSWKMNREGEWERID